MYNYIHVHELTGTMTVILAMLECLYVKVTEMVKSNEFDDLITGAGGGARVLTSTLLTLEVNTPL